MNRVAGTLVHLWNCCHGCGAKPISGLRFSCQSCPSGPDNDLCERCYKAYKERGAIKHPAADSADIASVASDHVFREYEGSPAAAYDAWLALPGRSELPPSLPHRCILRPEFCCGKRSFFGSHSFLVSGTPVAAPILLTAIHVMDELVRSHGIDCSPANTSYSGQELARVVTTVNVYDVFAANWMGAYIGSVGPMLPLANARIGDEEPLSHRDIAAFYATELTGGAAIPAAAFAPEPGEIIWLAANSGDSAKRKLLPAVTVESTPDTLIYRYLEHTGPRFTSGAPMVNKRGEAVGINCGAGYLQRLQFGHANTMTSIKRHLSGVAE
jgi:Zinc finger, ZZ type